MKKFSVIFCTALICIACVFAFAGCAAPDTELAEQVAAIDAGLTALKSANEATDTTIEGLEDTAAELRGELEAIEADITALETKNADIEAKIAALEDSDGEADELIANLEAQNEAIEADIAALEEAKTTVTGLIEAIEEDIADLVAKDEEIDAAIADIREDLAGCASKDTVAGLNDALTSATSQLSDLSLEVSTAKLEINSAKNEITSIKSRLSTVEASVTQLTTDFAAINTTLSALTDKITALEAEVAKLNGKFACFEAGSHTFDENNICSLCGEYNVIELAVGGEVEVDFSKNGKYYLHITTEIGQEYYLSSSWTTGKSHYIDYYSEDGELVSARKANRNMIANAEGYYLVVHEQKPENDNVETIGFKESTFLEEPEGTIFYELSAGGSVHATVQNQRVWVKVDNTGNALNGYQFITSIPDCGSAFRFYPDGMFLEKWNSSYAFTHISMYDFEEHAGVMYFQFAFKDEVEDGTEVVIDLTKKIVFNMPQWEDPGTYTITLDDPHYVGENGILPIYINYAEDKVFEISGDLGTVDDALLFHCTRLGDKDGVAYVSIDMTFHSKFGIKVTNSEGELTIKYHNEHTEHEDGKCICGTDIVAE